jgi:hypothetical protein
MLFFAILIINLHNKQKLTEPLYVSYVNTSFIIGQQGGFSVDADFLNLGRVTPGGSGKRGITFYPLDEDVLVHLEFYGNITDNVKVSENDFILEDESKEIEVYIVNSSYLDYGNYSGQLGIFYYDPRILTLD